MPDHISWRLLPVAAPGIPNLLVSANFAADSYKLHLTDLANVWVENMERKPIIKRGLVEDTSVDPSDGPDQLRRMLELLRAAFDPNEPEHPNTSLSIANDKGDSLLLHATCVLPKPLKPLKWPMHLSKCSHTTLTTQLVLPLILAHEARAREAHQLIVALREKDAVIARLADKLEATGTGLEHVFNTLSGQRKVTRATAEGRVKGLAPFQEVEFRSKATELQLAADRPGISSVLERVFGATGLRYRSDMDLEASRILDDWWTKLGKGQNIILANRPNERTTETPGTTQTVTAKSADNDEDDEFQVQATPPGLSSARKRGTNTRPDVVDDDETSDGEETGEIPDRLHPPSHTARPSGSRIVARGGRRQPPDSASPQGSPRPTHAKGKALASSTASETASDNDEDDQMDSPPLRPAAKRGGLGRIGGKPPETAPISEPARSPPPSSLKAATVSPRGHRLGVIGKKPTAEPSPQAESPSQDGRGRSRTPAGVPKKDIPRETSQERADRKRAELQKELERRAAAPAKKKRKF